MSNVSLKASLPALAGILTSETAISLYERQKILVAGGLLHLAPGRGPGSGVRATPEAVAVLVCSLLVSTSLTGDLAKRTRGISETTSILPPPGPAAERPPYIPAGGTRFIDALVRILTDETLAALIAEIEVDTSFHYTVIRFENTLPIVFIDRDKSASAPPIRTRNSISKDTIRALAAEVAKLTASTREEQ